MNEEQRKAVIPELDTLVSQAKEIEKKLEYLMSRLGLYQDLDLNKAAGSADRLVSTLREVNDTLTRSGANWIQSSVTSWYRALHYDMHPLVEVPEDEITDPTFESIAYDGDNTWTIIMTTKTHGRERIIMHSDGATWDQVYSVDRL